MTDEMTEIEKKAWSIAHTTNPGLKDTHSRHREREEAARLGIIVGLEMAANQKHEKPPVDRKLLCAREAMKSWVGGGAGPETICVRAIELYEEGFGK
jgi:hypothetical protein